MAGLLIRLLRWNSAAQPNQRSSAAAPRYTPSAKRIAAAIRSPSVTAIAAGESQWFSGFGNRPWVRFTAASGKTPSWLNSSRPYGTR
jgi:hypothetical protein